MYRHRALNVTFVLGLICAGKDVIKPLCSQSFTQRIDLVSIVAVSAVAGHCVCLEGLGESVFSADLSILK